MRTEHLEYLAAVTRCGSLRRASEELHVSQPALSDALTKLEKELHVTLLDRHRSGARISREGQDLLPYMADILLAVHRLRAVVGSHGVDHTVRVGTVQSATSSLLMPALRDFESHHPGTRVEVATMPMSQIDAALADGSLDLGVVNVLDGDDPPAGLDGTDLLHGRPIAVLPPEHPLVPQATVTVADLRDEPFIMMRPGHVMHRYVQRAFAPDCPHALRSAEGADMGMALVAERLGVTILPDYSVIGAPLHRAGLVAARPITNETTAVTLQLRRRRAPQPAPSVRALHAALIANAWAKPAS